MAMEMLSQSPALVKDSMLALAAITQYDAFDTVMYTGGLLCFAWAIVTVSTGGNGAKPGLQRFLIGYIILLFGAKTQLDMVITNPVTAESYAVADVPGGIAVLGWGTSAVASTFKDMYETEMTPPGVGGVLTRNGVGRGLAVLTGMQGVPWSQRSRTAGNTGTNFTNIEQSINNYLEDCFNQMMTSEGGEFDRWNTFHAGGETGSLTGIWQRVQAPIVMGTVVYINSASEAGLSRSCSDAWSDINGVISSAVFEDALEEDAIDHYAKQLAAMSMPGASVNLAAGISTDLVRAQLKAEADEMLTAFFSGTEMRSRILFLDKMNTALLNAYNSSPRGQVLSSQGRLASAWDDAKRQSDLSMAAQGDWWVRNAKPMTQYMELIVLGFLPIMLFMMFASPNGGKGLMGVVFVYFWIQSWPIAYIILNHAAMGSMVATFDQFLSSTTAFGMEDLYELWDQARHSYAVSQSLLGMTPLITGMMLTGSVMMLTKVASGIGSTENLDEKRVYNDTESSAPVRQGVSQTQQMLNPNGTVSQNQDTTSTGTDINVQDTLNQQVAEAEKASQTAQNNYNNQVANTKAKAVQDMTTNQMIDVITQKSGYSEGVDSSAVSSSSIVESQATSWMDKQSATAATRISGDAGYSFGRQDREVLEKLKSGDEGAKDTVNRIVSSGPQARAQIAASAGISTELATALTNEFRESEEFRFALGEMIKADEAFSDQDTLQKLNAASNTLTDQDMQQLSNTRSEMKAKEKAFGTTTSRAASVSSGATITEGRQWKLVDDIAKEMLMGSSQLSGQERIDKMREIAQKRGLDSSDASIMAKIVNMESWDQHAPSNAGGFVMGAGVLQQMRNSSMGNDDLNKFIVANEERLGNNFKSEIDQLNVPKNDIDTSDVPEYGQVATKAGNLSENAPIATANGELTGEAAIRAEKLKAAVTSKTDFLEKQKTFKEEMAGKLDKIQARDDGEFSATDLLDGGAQELNIGAYPQALGSTISMEAERRVIETLSLAGVAAQYQEDNAKFAIDGYNNMTKEQQTEALGQLQQKEVDQVMSNLLRGNDKVEYDKLISSGDNETASSYLQDKMGAAGIQTDAASVAEFSEHIKNTFGLHEINNLDMFERIGNLIQGVDNDKVEIIRGELRNQVGNMSEGNSYGGLAYADNKAEHEYARVKEDLSGRRDGGARITDVILAELMSLASYVAQDNKGAEFQTVLDQVNNESSGLEKGFAQGLMNLAGSGKGHEGLSIDRGEIEKIFDSIIGDGAYEGYRAQMTNELKGTINSDEQAIIRDRMEEIKGKMNPQSEYLKLDDELKSAIDNLSLEGGQRDVMIELGQANRGAVLATESRYASYSAEAQKSVELSKIVDEVAGKGTYQNTQFKMIEEEVESFKGSVELMTTEFENKYGQGTYRQFEEWKELNNTVTQ